jgi:hypothetical protein
MCQKTKLKEIIMDSYEIKQKKKIIFLSLEHYSDNKRDYLLVLTKERKHGRYILRIDYCQIFRTEEIPSTPPSRPSTMKSRKQFVVCE